MTGIRDDEVSDNHLLHMLQKYLKAHPSDKLGSIYYCGAQTIRQPGAKSAAFVLSNNEHSTIFGTNCCHSSWACPRCTANTMAKYGARIANVIDALSTWYKQSAFMVTFTIPHSRKLRAETVFKILQLTWRKFVRAGNRGKYARADRGGRMLGADPYGLLRQELGIKHNVRVFEFTWSEKNGWHPHIHALFWVPNANFSKVLDYADRLNDRWWNCAKQASVEVLSQIYDGDKIATQSRVEEFFADWRKNPKTGHRSVYFSTDENGKLTTQKSSYYISGWTGEMEVTSGFTKLGRNGHFSPYQLLQKANENPNERDKYLKLFVEYAEATRGHRRFHFSKSGLNALVAKWRLTQTYMEQQKKKFTERDAAPYHVVCWFTAEQWSQLYLLNLQSSTCIISQILKLARLPNGNELITQLVAQYNIDISKNKTHRDIPLIESIFNPNAA